MILSMCNMDDGQGVVLTQSAKVCTHRVRRPPFWLIVTALDRNRYLPVPRVSRKECKNWVLRPNSFSEMGFVWMIGILNKKYDHVPKYEITGSVQLNSFILHKNTNRHQHNKHIYSTVVWEIKKPERFIYPIQI